MRRNVNKVLVIGLAFTFLLLFCGVNNPAQAGSRLAEITYIEGKVEIQKPGGSWKGATIGMLLSNEDRMRTGEKSLAEVKLDDGSLVKLEEETELSVIALDEVGPAKEKVSLFKLIVGEIKAKVLKILGKQSKFEVQTSACIAGVRGTDFSISAEADEAANIETYEGNVVVEGINERGERGAPLEVKPDFCSRTEKGKAPLPAQKIEAYRKAKWQLWDEKKGLFEKAKNMEKVKVALEGLRAKYNLAETGEEKEKIGKEAQKLKLIAIKLAHDMDKAKKEHDKDKEKNEQEVGKAIEEWKSLTPEQQAKLRMNYEIWKKIAPRLALMRKERLREALIRLKNLPPEARERLVRIAKFWRNLPPGQRQTIFMKIGRFKQLPPWVQKKAVENYRKFKLLPPGQRKKIVEGYKRWHNLPPEARENLKDGLERFKNLPPDKKKEMMKFHHEWQKIPPQQRGEWMKRYQQQRHQQRPGAPRPGMPQKPGMPRPGAPK